jgi:hypothetical protein
VDAIALKFPLFMTTLCLMVSLMEVVNTSRTPVDLFSAIDMPMFAISMPARPSHTWL